MSSPFGILSRIFRPTSARAGIEAAAGGRRWKGAAVLGTPQQAALVARKPAKDRAAGLYVNTPMGQRGVEALASSLVGGRGWQAQSQHPDRATARMLNAASEELTAPILPMLARGIVRDGEAFVRLMVDDAGLRLVLLPADQVDPELHRDLGGGKIVAGIEFDAEDRVVAYHVLRDAPGAPFARFTETARVPARDMLHVFDRLFPGQVRGLSWLVPVALKIGDHDAAHDALLMKLKVEALVTGFIRDASGGTGGFKDGETDVGDVSLEPGAMRILPPGTDVTFTSPGAGSAQAVEFLRSQQREIAAGLGLTYEQLTGDLSDTNYSSARVGLLEFRRRAEMLQRLLIEGQFLRPLWRRWIEIKALAGEIPAGEIETYQAARFVAPGWQWVDPAKEVAADIRAIEAGLKSRAEVVAGRGRDLAELDEEIAADTRQPTPEAIA